MKEGWEFKKLGECLSYIKNGANIKQTKGASGIPITRIETLSGGTFHRDRLGFADIFDTSKYALYILDDTDILMSHINSKAFIGRSVIYHRLGEEQIIHGMNLLRLKFFTYLIKPEFANYYFKCSYFRNEIAKHRKDAVNQSSIAISDLKKIPMPIPPLSEQQHIVEELDLLSSIIEKKKAQLKELDNLAQSIFYEMFGDPITNEKGWKKQTLERSVANDCKISYGIVQPGADTENGIPIVRPVDLGNHIVTLKGLKKTDKKISDAYKRTILKGNEILFCVRGTTGVMSFASFDLKGCNVTRGITPLAFGELANKYYAFYYLSSKYLQELIAEKTRGIALRQINIKDLRELPFLIPPLPLQELFASKIQSIEHQKALIKQSITEVETLFNSRMDYYFN